MDRSQLSFLPGAQLLGRLATSTRCDELEALRCELRKRTYAARYALRLRAQRIEELETVLQRQRCLRGTELLTERSLTVSLRCWAPELAEALERSTAAWPR